jgi:hypothetical protein
MAGPKGLEPSIFSVTGRRVNQLHHEPIDLWRNNSRLKPRMQEVEEHVNLATYGRFYEA